MGGPTGSSTYSCIFGQCSRVYAYSMLIMVFYLSMAECTNGFVAVLPVSASRKRSYACRIYRGSKSVHGCVPQWDVACVCSILYGIGSDLWGDDSLLWIFIFV